MELAGVFYIPYRSRTDEFRIWPIADVHLANRGTDVAAIKRDVETIRRDPHSFWFGLGDLGDYISPGDPRFDAAVQEMLEAEPDLRGDVGYAISKYVLSIFKPIAHKCIGLGIGNHEKKYFVWKEARHLHASLLEHMRLASGRPDGGPMKHAIEDLGYTAFFKLVFLRMPTWRKGPCLLRERPIAIGCESHTVTFHVHHGAGAAASDGGKANALTRQGKIFIADVLVQAHLHSPDAKPRTMLGVNKGCTEMVARTCLLVRTGPYLKTYAKGVGGYGEERMYEATTIGATPIRIRPQTRQLSVETVAGSDVPLAETDEEVVAG